MTPSPSARELAGVAFVALVFGMAPTVGDVGGCGAAPEDMSSALFANERKLVDCKRCTECAIDTARCRRACTPNAPTDTVIPKTCRPLVHDGEVCLRALEAASCSSYSRYVADDLPSTPSECAFCRFEDPDGGT
ncbi:MAG: hypothetical protein U0169_13975 [Polyangiaceae bacterium]